MTVTIMTTVTISDCDYNDDYNDYFLTVTTMTISDCDYNDYSDYF